MEIKKYNSFVVKPKGATPLSPQPKPKSLPKAKIKNKPKNKP